MMISGKPYITPANCFQPLSNTAILLIYIWLLEKHVRDLYYLKKEKYNGESATLTDKHGKRIFISPPLLFGPSDGKEISVKMW
ncbi:MAG: hypothetical protein ACLTOM_00295 [Roseburia sp.]